MPKKPRSKVRPQRRNEWQRKPPTMREISQAMKMAERVSPDLAETMEAEVSNEVEAEETE